MSYSFTAAGDAGQVKSIFEAERAKCAGWGMVADELADIDAAAEFAVSLAKRHGKVSVSCAGHWVIFGEGDKRNTFGRVYLDVNHVVDVPAAVPDTTPPKS